MHSDDGSAGGRADRPDPDTLLARVAAEEERARHGRLRIFLGYAAGVGKTYAMLQAAQARRAEGVDAVVAYVETHARPETNALLEGLEVVPRRELEYRGARLSEADPDAVLARRPTLALFDEFAHTNAPGSRHPKRHLDVAELLQAGIDVYTTLNIQHVESLADVVVGITGAEMRERVPDGVLDEAAEITLIDLPPDELRRRLRDGKVYVPEQAALATERFFRPGNLMALRELATRWAARRADDDMQAFMQAHAIKGPWAASERLLVCVSGSPQSERLIRATRRLADELRAEWHAIHVETTAVDRISRENRARIWSDLALAERLGARTSTIAGASVDEALIRFARDHNITKILVGRSSRGGGGWFRRPAPAEALIRARIPIDLLLVGDDGAPHPAEPPRERPGRSPVSAYLVGVAYVVLATLFGELVRRHLAPTNLVMPYLVVVVLAALRLGRGPAIVSAGLSVLAFDLFFVPPRLSIAVQDTEYLLTFLGLFLVGVVVSTLVARARDRTEAAREREAQTATLFGLSRDLAVAGNADAIADAAVRHIGGFLREEAVVLVASGATLAPLGAGPPPAFSHEELAVAGWVVKNGLPAGRGTDTVGSLERIYFPLQTSSAVVGVIGVRLSQPVTDLLDPGTRHMLEAFASQVGLALERVAFAGQAHQARVLEEADRLHRAILNSLSHDLRTPLATITGALSSLAGEGVPMPDATRRELLANAREEAGRLNRFVGNLLDMSRLEAGALRLQADWHDVDDLIGAALVAVGPRAGSRPVNVQAPPDLPPVRADFVLLVQALVNVLDNALRYAPPDGPIDIVARAVDGAVEIAVEDRGPGIPAGDREQVFEKFYRVERGDRGGGAGLGLAICRGIVEAHGGTVRAEGGAHGGARIVLKLPAVAPPAVEAES